MNATEFKAKIDDYLSSLGLPPLSDENDFSINSALFSFNRDGDGYFFAEYNLIIIKGEHVACRAVQITKDGIDVTIQIGVYGQNQIFVINPTPERLDILIKALSFSESKSVTDGELRYYRNLCQTADEMENADAVNRKFLEDEDERKAQNEKPIQEMCVLLNLSTK